MLITRVDEKVHVAGRLKFHSVDKEVFHADQKKCGELCLSCSSNSFLTVTSFI